MEEIEHFSHRCYKLTFHEFYERPEDPVYCRACCQVISGPAYICNHEYSLIEDSFIYGLHKSCAELPTEIQHPLHPQHRLRVPLNSKYHNGELETLNGFICDICRHYSWGFCYGCDDCEFKLDVRCVFNYHDQSQPPLKRRVEKVVSYHQHKLQLFYHDGSLPSIVYYEGIHENLVCCCCLYGFKDSGYGCMQCNFFIHETCLDIPQQVQSSIYPQHLLCLGTDLSSRYEVCRLCIGRFRFGRTSLGCETSHGYYARFHVICGKSTTQGLRVKFHEHNMFYTRAYSSLWDRVRNGKCYECDICKGICTGTTIYSCIDCQVYAHIECIPLPRVIVHECHLDHPLTLVDSIIQKNNNEMYMCDICETEGYLKRHLYYCEECNCTAHIECVLSEEHPPLEILEYLVPRSTKDESNQAHDDDEETETGSDEVQGPDAEKEQESQSQNCKEDVDALDEEIKDLEIEMAELAKKIELLKAKRLMIINESS